MIEQLFNVFLESGRVSTDSRNISEGDMFFAIRGENFNGNRFADDAINKGAAVAVIDDPAFATHDQCLLVPDALKALQNLASLYRRKLAIPLVAITGTNGKTTTKELISRILQKKFRTGFTEGNLNNHIGVPLTILSFPQNSEIAVLEMGANHIREIETLCNIASPTHGIITNIGKAHIEGFGSQQGIVQAKSELYHYLREHQGLLFVNSNDPLLMKLSVDVKRVTYGTDNHADTYATLISEDPFLEILWQAPDGELRIKTGLYGSYNFQNILAAIAAGQHFGVASHDIVSAIQSYTPSNNRSQIVKTQYNTVYLDAYNANPSSMAQILHFFAGRKTLQNKVLILGDMLELGSEALTEHRRILDTLQQMNFSLILLVGKTFSGLSGSYPYRFFDNPDDLKSWLLTHPVNHAEIFIKGSRKIGLEKVLTAL